MDKLSHASIVDAAFLAQAKVMVYKHNKPDSLEMVLKRINRDRKGGVLIVGEGVYGMTGDLANLKDICGLARKYDARVFIDDAHGWGVMGEKGRGTADHFGVQDQIDLYFGTFAKAFASIGGFTASAANVINWIRYNARTQVFAKSLPMVYVKSLQKTFELVRKADKNRERMWKISNDLKKGLEDLGYFIGYSGSPICPVFIPIENGSVEKTGMLTVKYLRDNGVFVSGVMYPVIPIGLLMYRLIPTAAHIPEDVDRTIEAFRKMRDELGLDISMDPEARAKIDKVYGK
jgi:glycine C-acetyltransferase